MKAFADNKINMTKEFISGLGKDRKHCGKRRECWLPVFVILKKNDFQQM